MLWCSVKIPGCSAAVGSVLTASRPQALHFFIGLGALISPLVADPFLTEGSCILNSTGTPSYDHFPKNTSGQEAALDPVSTYGAQAEGRGLSSVSYAFWIMALINVSSWAPFVETALKCFQR